MALWKYSKIFSPSEDCSIYILFNITSYTDGQVVSREWLEVWQWHVKLMHDDVPVEYAPLMEHVATS